MQMMRAKCGSCNWIFDVCALPMPITDAARVMERATCCMCGSKETFVAEQRALTSEETVHKEGVIAGARALA